MTDSLWPHGLQHTKLPCPSPTPRACSNSCALSQWCHPTISSSVTPFSSCFQSFPASGYFPMSQFFTLGGQSIGVSASASVLPMNIRDWFPLGLTGLISLLSMGHSRVLSSTTNRLTLSSGITPCWDLHESIVLCGHSGSFLCIFSLTSLYFCCLHSLPTALLRYTGG